MPSDINEETAGDASLLRAALAAVGDGDQDLQRMVHLAATACNAPVAILALWQNSDRIRIKASHGVCLSGRVMKLKGLNGRLCVSPRPVLIEDLKGLQNGNEFPMSIGMRFYASTPIVAADGTPCGTLAVFDNMARPSAPLGLMDTLKGMAQVVADTLRLKATVEAREIVRLEIAKTKESLEEANRSKTEFLANMSHELRTPLNAILGFSELLKDQMFGPLGSEKYCEYAQDINNSAAHLLSLINDILDLSKIEAGAFIPSLEECDLSEIIAPVARILRHRSSMKEIDVRLPVAPCGTSALLDVRGMRQVMLNLLSNAVKFSPRVGVVEVTVNRMSDGGASVEVRDNGIGMDADEIEIAFQPFRQVEHAMSKKAEGTGLGLPIARRIVEAHGGALEIESARGVGTTARVTLPSSALLAASDVVPSMLLKSA